MKQRPQRPLGPDDYRLSGRARHGMSRAERHRREAEQRNACVICGRVAPLVQDHDHSLAGSHAHPLGRGCPMCNRALLCDPCNSVLGFAREDPAVLRRAAQYVEFWARELDALSGMV